MGYWLLLWNFKESTETDMIVYSEFMFYLHWHHTHIQRPCLGTRTGESRKEIMNCDSHALWFWFVYFHNIRYCVCRFNVRTEMRDVECTYLHWIWRKHSSCIARLCVWGNTFAYINNNHPSSVVCPWWVFTFWKWSQTVTMLGTFHVGFELWRERWKSLDH